MSARWMIAAWCFVGCFPDPPVADVSDGDDVADSAPGDDGADGGAEADGATPDVADTLAEAEVADTLAEAEVADTTEIADTTEVADTTGDTEDASTVPDTELADTVADTADAAPDSLDDTSVVDADVSPCPAGCEHLDDACHTGVCGPLGCESIELTGPCDDDDPCTLDDRCEAGACIGDEVVCEALDTCHIAGVCDPDTGVCSSPAKLDTSPCDDGDACTEDEGCAAGVCTGGHVPDDSEDWWADASAEGASIIVPRADGSAWWFLELSATTTQVGAAGGAEVTLTLPGGDVAGVGAVHYAPDGAVLASFVVVSTAATVDLVPGAEHASVHRDVLGRDVLTLAFTFTGTATLGTSNTEALEVTSGAPRAYVVARLLADGQRLAHWKIENPGFTSSFNYREGAPPAIAIASDGRFAVSTAIQSDVEAEIGALGALRSQPGQVTTWTVAFTSAGAALWQRALIGTAGISGAFPQVASYADDGALIIGGRLVGVVDWRRLDAADVLGQLGSSGSFALFVARVDAGADLERIAELGGTSNLLVQVAASRSSRVAMTVLAGAEVTLVGPPPARSIIADLPGTASQFAVIDCDVPCGSPHIYLDEDKTLVAADHRADGPVLLTASSGATSLTADGVSLYASVDAVAAIVGVSPHTWSLEVALRQDVADALQGLELAIGADQSLWLAGRTGATALQLLERSAWSIPANRGFIARINSEDGRVCADR